jgi:hypothetical protein
MLYAGTATWFIAGGTASRQAFGDPAAPRRFHVDPTWILDVLEYVAHEERRAADHHAFSCDLEDTGDAILPPPHRGRRRPRITGEAWLDGAGRIRRVTWRASGTVTWTTTDLWDFGTPVELDLPEPQSSPSTLRVLYGWRRAKRAYERGR